MKVTDRKESIELCTESGWSAYDLFVDGEITEEEIRRLGVLGDLTYLGMLSQPFYRIEQQYYMIKGLEHEKKLRVAMLGGQEAILEQVQELLEQPGHGTGVCKKR